MLRYSLLLLVFVGHLVCFSQFTDVRLLDYSESSSDYDSEFQVVDYNGDGYLDFCQFRVEDDPYQTVLLITENLFDRKFATRRIVIPAEYGLYYNIWFYDLDGNGLADLIRQNGSDNSQVLLQLSPDEFTPGSMNTGYSGNYIYQIFDYNGDGIKDLFLGNSGDALAILTNDGFGNLNTVVEFAMTTPSSGVNFENVKWFDYDNDGDLDIVAPPNSYGPYMHFYWLENDSASFPNPWVDFLSVDNYIAQFDWEMADFNNDNMLDFAFQNLYGLTVFLRSELNYFIYTYSENDITCEGIETMDFDGDGDVDISCGEGYYNVNGFIINQGGGNFPITSFSSSFSPRMVGDFDNDGLDDVFLAQTSNKCAIKWNNGGGDFTNLEIIAAHATTSRSVGFDSNTLAGHSFCTSAGHSEANYVNCYNINHNGDLKNEIMIASMPSTRSCEALPLNDFDNDGFNDLIYYVSEGNDGARFYFRKGINEFLESPIELFFIPEVGNPPGFSIISDAGFYDQDHDGDKDIIIRTTMSNYQLLFAENNGTSFEQPAVLLPNGSGGILLDFENDGDCDLLKTNQLYLYESGAFIVSDASVSDNASYYSQKRNQENGLIEFVYVSIPENTEQDRLVRTMVADSLGYYTQIDYPLNNHPSLNALEYGNGSDFLVVDLDNDSIDDILYAQQNLLFTIHGTVSGYEVTQSAFVLPSDHPNEILSYDYDEDTDEDIFISLETGWYVLENHNFEPAQDPLDFNGDGTADELDLQLLLNNFGCQNTCNEFDLNQDGVITVADIAIFIGLIGG